MILLRKTVFAFIALLALIIATLLVLVMLALPINLAPLQGFVESGLASVLARPVSIADVEWRPGLKSELTLTEVRIGNPHGWVSTEDFARIGRMQVQFDLLSLLQGELVLQSVRGDQIELWLAKDASNLSNWQFQLPGDAIATPDAGLPVTPDDLSLRHVSVHYQAAEDTASTQLLQLTEIHAKTVSTTALQLTMTGQCPQVPCELSADLQYTGTGLTLSKLEAILGTNTISGELSVNNPGSAVAQLTGSLHVPTLALMNPDRARAEAIIPQETLQQARQAEARLGLDKERIRQAQAALTRRGFDTRGVDGIFGKNTRHAIQAFQKSLQYPPSGYLTAGQLAALLDESTPSITAHTSSLLDQTLPTGLEWLNADFDLVIDRLILPGDIEIGAFHCKAQLRNGQLDLSSLRGELGDNRFDGALALDLRAQPARVRLNLSTQHVDLGALLRDLRLAKGIDLSGEAFKAEVAAQGTTLLELLAGSSIDATLTDARWTLNQAEGKTNVLKLARSRLQSLPGQPVMITSEVQLNGQPLSLLLQSEPRADRFVDPNGRLQLHAKAAAAELVLSSTASLLFNQSPLSAQLQLSGDRLDRLGSLLAVPLPPLGPYTLAGTLRISESDYQLQDLELDMGASDLRGRLLLALDRKTPHLELELNSDQLQLEDIGLAPRPGQASSAQAGVSASDLIDRSQHILGQWLLSDAVRHLNVHLDLATRRLLLAGSELGPLAISATLQNGRLTLQRGRIGLADGPLSLQLDLQPQAGGLKTELSAFVDHLDYGKIARLLQPRTTMRGWLSLAASLSSQTAVIDTFSGHASGPVRFILKPQVLEAGPLALWELNLLGLLLPRLDDSGSKINCIAGRLVFDNGIVKLSPGDLLIDTTKVRASAEGEIDFKNRRLDLTLVPKVKAPRAFDLAAAVKVSGSFDEFAANLAPGSLIKTLVSLPLGLNRLWLRFFDWQDIPPADGSDICSQLPPPAPSEAQAGGGSNLGFRN